MKWSRKHRRNNRGEVETRIEFADGKELPAVAELVPRSLFARVHLDEQPWAGSDAIPCWTYVSDGLRAHGQKELLLTLRRNDDEPPETFPREPFRFFTLMHSFAEQGRVVDAGDYSLLSAPFFGRRSTPFTAVAYIRRSPPSGFDLSAPHPGTILADTRRGRSSPVMWHGAGVGSFGCRISILPLPRMGRPATCERRVQEVDR